MVIIVHHLIHRKKNILKLGEGLTFGIKATHGAAEKGLVLTLVKLAQNFA